jgi:hypothetical protein
MSLSQYLLDILDLIENESIHGRAAMGLHDVDRSGRVLAGLGL